MIRSVRSTTIVIVAAIGVLFTVEGSRIYFKAILAQYLLQNAWSNTQNGTVHSKPWPWADTWPVARLSSIEHGEDMIVLAGATGRTMAFGPAHVLASAKPGEAGNTVLTGHRDTHFSFLEQVQVNDVLELESADGITHRYRVGRTSVVHESDIGVMGLGKKKKLTLITCFPFDALTPGGPLRYIVSAIAVN